MERALETVEIRPTIEDVFNLETESVQEYLERVHEMTVVSAIQVQSILCFGASMSRHPENNFTVYTMYTQFCSLLCKAYLYAVKVFVPYLQNSTELR